MVLALYKNGAAFKSVNLVSTSATAYLGFSIVAPDLAAAGDVYAVYVYNDDTVNRTIYAASPAYTYFVGAFLGR
jgi:hypothetical protein